MTRCVIAIHGVSNRSEEAFGKEVDGLRVLTGTHERWNPVYWGNLAAQTAFLDHVIPPVLDLGVRSGEAMVSPELVASLLDGDAAAGATTETRAGAVDPADVVVAAAEGSAEAGTSEVRTADSELGMAIRQAVAESRYVRHVRDEQVLRDVGRIIAGAVAEEGTSHEVRGGISDLVGVVKRVMDPIDDLIAAVAGRALGAVNQLGRRLFIGKVATFLGDILVYQRHRAEIHARIWQTIDSDPECAGSGRDPDRPVTVIAHSLGGVIAFDAAVAGDPQLHIDRLVTFGSQSPLFHLMDPRDGAASIRLPPYANAGPIPVSNIGRWLNVYEPLDPLAFIAARVFKLQSGGPVDDRIAEHRPEAGIYTHSDYWQHQGVADEIQAALRS